MGRDAELATVRRAVRGAGLIVAGPAGVGKTRLLDEVVCDVRLRATAAMSAIPLGVMAPFLPSVDPSPLAMLAHARAALHGRVVVVDDIHLVDDATAGLLHQLVQHREAVVVATLRSGELAPDPVVALWKDELLPRIELEPLGRAAVVEVLETVLGGVVDSVTADRLWTTSAGNMLLLREMHFAAAWVSHGGVWSLDGSLPLSPRLVELVETHLATVPDEERRLLELLAFGEPLDLAASEALDGLVTVTSDGLRLAHPLYGEVLRAQCPPLRKRNHQRHLASVINDPLRVALLRLDSGTADDPAELVTAARLAIATGGVVLAERLARAAWSIGGGLEAAQLLGQVLVFTDRAEEAEEIFARVATDDDPIELRAMRALNLGWGLGRSEEAARMVDDDISRAVLLFDAGEYDEARALLSYDAPEQATVLAMIDAVQGRYVGPFPVIPPNPGVGLGSEMTLLAEVFVYSLHGDLARAERFAVQAYREKAEWDTMRTTWAVSLAALARAGGRLLEARRLLQEVRPVRPFVRLCELAYVESMLGNDARSLLAEAEELNPPGQRPYRHGLWFARIWAAGASPFEAAADARAHGEFAAEALLLHEAVRLGHAAEALDRLRELASTTTGLLVPVFAAHAEASVRKDSAALVQVAARFEQAGFMLLAAEAAAESGNRALFGRLAGLCEGARTPALAGMAVAPLTRREREIAVLAARGLTNKEIAEALVISVRTVDNHLSNAYAKLGIAARAELAEALGG
ncbi:DNA-binding response regulator, NarL/FixJ family, contains REC and HTH domains [Lentzea xinjiangensis]|uniref:DNA-binding response regulator, NarL/FixJ family, contains REC and HTH domains n=1 Tax=Lentzea xinjiangensis TaxID=402600 RepID=A0A1H9VBZ5_9PSEU|nr:DNA-binding response regulator, NarL/FixJ family, contains REC and HTH domains [Lentzea xinjiangensis]